MPAAFARQGAWAISLAALLIALPIIIVVFSPLLFEAPEWSHVWRYVLPDHLVGTLLLVAGTLVPALVLAVPAAWLVAAHEFPGRRIFRWALVLPLAVPTYISAYSYAALLGPTGSLTIWMDERTGFRPDIMSLPGLCLVLAMVLQPYIYLSARAVFTKGMGAHLDAARLLGAGPWRRFFRVALPLARPAIVAGALLVAMETLNDFGAVKHFGERTLTTGLFRSWGGLYDLGSALRIGAVLVAMVAILLWIERRSRAGASQANDQAISQRVRITGPRAALATGWCALVLFAGSVLPLAKLISDAWTTADAAAWAALLPAFGNTMLVALLAAACTLFLAVLFTFRERHGGRPDWLIRAAGLGYAIPGAVIAVGAMAIAGAIDRSHAFGFALIGSLGLLTYAFTTRFLAVGSQPLRAALEQQPRALDESAKLLGASPGRAFLRINLPLLRPALLAAALLVAIDVIKELPLTLILRPFNFHTLSTRAYEAASIEQLPEASLPALLIVACGLLPLLVLDRLMERKA